MTWVLVIHIVMVTTCQEGFSFCPPAKPPVLRQHTYSSAQACQVALAHFRERFPAQREIARTPHMVFTQQATVQCLLQSKSEGDKP